MKKFIFIKLIAICIISCGSGNDAKNEKEMLLKSITDMENNIKSNLHNFNPAIADSLSKEYAHFAKSFPEDSLAPKYLFKAADLTISTRKFKKAISLFDTIPTLYPNFNRNADCKFMIAFIYDEHLKLKDEAATAYDAMIKAYPDHRLASDAKLQKENLKYSNEELIKMFENKNAISKTK